MKEEYLVAKKELDALFDKIKINHPKVSLIVSAAFPDDEKDKTENMMAVYGHPVDLAALVDHIVHKNPILIPILTAMFMRALGGSEMDQAINDKPI